MSKATAAAPLSTANEVPAVLRPARQSKPTLIDAPRQTKTPAALARQLHRDNHGAAATPALSSRLSLPSHSDRRATRDTDPTPARVFSAIAARARSPFCEQAGRRYVGSR